MSRRDRSLQAELLVFGRISSAQCFAIRRIDRGRDDAEVLAGIVGADIEEAVAVIDVVLLFVESGRDDEETPPGVSAGRKRYSLVVWLPASIRRIAVAGLADAEVEALVLFFADDGVFCRAGSPTRWRKSWSWRLVTSSSVV